MALARRVNRSRRLTDSVEMPEECRELGVIARTIRAPIP